MRKTCLIDLWMDGGGLGIGLGMKPRGVLPAASFGDLSLPTYKGTSCFLCQIQAVYHVRIDSFFHFKFCCRLLWNLHVVVAADAGILSGCWR